MRYATVLAAVAAGFVALASSPPASGTGYSCSPVTNTLSNGSPETTDGALRITVDGLGAFGASIGAHAIFNPTGPVGAADTVYSSNLYLSSADELLRDCREGRRAQELSRSSTSLVTRATAGSVRIDLDQELAPSAGGRSALTQAYTLTNAGAHAVTLRLVRHVDGDLHFDGTIDDGGAVSGAGRLLYEFDRSDDPASPSTFVGIAGDLDGADAPARWTIQEFDYRDDIRKANGIRSDDDGSVRNDENSDGIVDTPYDVTLSQQWNTSLAPGESVTFVTRTLFGREPPQNQTPVAVADALTTAEDTAGIVDVLANDSDPDGDTVSLVGATNGAHGSVTCDGGRCTYTPAADYNGADSFTYTVTDTHGATASGSVDVTVTPVDEPKQTLTVTKVGNARITSTPAGIDCGDVCTAEFEVGTVVTLTATPDPGWAFAGWSGACAGSTTCVVTVDAGKAVTASFELPPPTPTQNVNVTPVSGEVFVKLPGSTQFVPLTEPSQVPMGSQIDATRGRVELKSGRDAGVTEVSTFYDGAFEMTQAAAADLVELRLILGDFSVCAQPSLQAANKNTRPIRRLWGNGKGKYRTRGKYSSATVRGTVWKTEDRCDGTLTKVDEGSVTVRDFGRQLNIVVKAPKSYLAEPLPRGVSGAGCTIIGTSRRDVLRGTPRRDVICGLAGNDVLVGLGGNDKLLGGDGNDRLNGGRGNDVLDGGAGRDWMDGGPGVDVLRGGRGIDFLVSSGKPDRLHGGPGADRCRARTVRACP